MLDRKPELRMGKNLRLTEASLRDHYRWQVSHMDGMDRMAYAYFTLRALARPPAGVTWTKGQIRAVADGLDLGMKEGLR